MLIVIIDYYKIVQQLWIMMSKGKKNCWKEKIGGKRKQNRLILRVYAAYSVSSEKQTVLILCISSYQLSCKP